MRFLKLTIILIGIHVHAASAQIPFPFPDNTIHEIKNVDLIISPPTLPGDLISVEDPETGEIITYPINPEDVASSDYAILFDKNQNEFIFYAINKSYNGNISIDIISRLSFQSILDYIAKSKQTEKVFRICDYTYKSGYSYEYIDILLFDSVNSYLIIRYYFSFMNPQPDDEFSFSKAIEFTDVGNNSISLFDPKLDEYLYSYQNDQERSIFLCLYNKIIIFNDDNEIINAIPVQDEIRDIYLDNIDNDLYFQTISGLIYNVCDYKKSTESNLVETLIDHTITYTDFSIGSWQKQKCLFQCTTQGLYGSIEENDKMKIVKIEEFGSPTIFRIDKRYAIAVQDNQAYLYDFIGPSEFQWLLDKYGTVVIDWVLY